MPSRFIGPKNTPTKNEGWGFGAGLKPKKEKALMTASKKQKWHARSRDVGVASALGEGGLYYYDYDTIFSTHACVIECRIASG